MNPGKVSTDDHAVPPLDENPNGYELLNYDMQDILNEYEELFMKNKADIGRCKIAKHRIELKPEAVPCIECSFIIVDNHKKEAKVFCLLYRPETCRLTVFLPQFKNRLCCMNLKHESYLLGDYKTDTLRYGPRK